ncbi:MAG: Fic family protein [Caldilineales bacterium]|nr:Fic family protein [Caldilineales bacterium]MCW5858002.1 Fic family protein [Caldilineales bacterium]
MSTPWRPSFTITPLVAQRLMAIEAAKAVVERTPLSVAAEAELRQRARLRSAHYSTRIEGNRLTLEEAERAITQARLIFSGRERDAREVRNYWQALLRVETWATQGQALTEDLIRRLHALVEYGPRAKPTPYRDGQNVIRDAATGAIVYLPPEAKDVPGLMQELAAWARQAEADGLPAPLIAGLVHYQFVTIHPYFDGNGRTARLLATFILHRNGYGLNGFFSLEEYHAHDLPAYYRALVTHPHHNYYEGRAEADLTPWLVYFVDTLARVFKWAQEQALRLSQRPPQPEPEALRQLDPRARLVLGLFTRTDRITAADVARILALSERSARNLVADWVQQGLLEIVDPSRRARSYRLSAIYRQAIGSLSAMHEV